MKAFLVAGGSIEKEFLKKSYKEGNYDLVIGIDGGAAYLLECDIAADIILGDFDTLDKEILDYYKSINTKIEGFKAEKDETDTELGIDCAIEAGADEIHLYGATGTRLDHVLGNIQSLRIASNKNIKAYIIDTHNKIHYVNQRETIKKNEQYGKYISFVPMTAKVKGVTLRGFKYPLENGVLVNDKSLAISNQIESEEAVVSYEEGVLLMIESKDWKYQKMLIAMMQI